MLKKLITSLIILINLFIKPLYSELEFTLDNKGTDFWLTFLPNYHNSYRSENPREKYGDSLFIFISASEPSKGMIEFSNRNGDIDVNFFQIDDISKMYVFKVSYWDYELRGFNLSGSKVASGNECEIPALNSFHITSDKEVTVYALSQAQKTSDAFMVLPTDVLGNFYLIMSYKSDGNRTSEYNSDFYSSTPSQFAIVATEDSTIVSIIPKAKTFRNGLSTQRITINKGQVYLVQALIDLNNLELDLTGTQIVSNKPIAVFSGHQRATVPVPNNYSNPSRDILVEQLPPVSTWGKNAIVVPFAKSQNEMREGESLFRILSAEDNTDVFIDGAKVTTLKKGDYYEGILNRAMTITSNNPILVAGFKKTTGNRNYFLQFGDPFFVIFPPIEQYMNQYRIINAQAYEYVEQNYNKVYVEQYVTIIIPSLYLNSLKVDGLYPNWVNFTSIPSSDYVYATIPVSDGVHFIEADTTIGILVYGYGQANSYGYIGGCNFKRLNFFEPLITMIPSDSCFIVKGVGTKRRANDASLSRIIIVDSLLYNCTLAYYDVSRDSIYFSFQLVDIKEDGSFGVCVIDTLNLKSEIFSTWIPGFTVSAPGFENSDDCPNESIVIAKDKELCVKATIANYGRFNQKVYRAFFKNLQIEKVFTPPLKLNPKEEFTFNLCFAINSDTSITDTLLIENDCANRNVLSITIEVISDKFVPKVFLRKDTCNRYADILITDSLPIDRGLKEIQILETDNCFIDVFDSLPHKIFLKIKVDDLTKDSFYRIVAWDSVGNSTEFSDTLQGFTLDVFAVDSNSIILFDSLLVGQIYCKKILLHNYGILPLNLDNLHFRNNIVFSIPPSALPILIQPKDQIELPVCFNPNQAGLNFDTLMIPFLCDNYQVLCQGKGLVNEFIGTSNCDIGVVGRATLKKNQVLVYEIFTNPSTIVIDLPILNLGKGTFQIQIFNFLGQKVFDRFVNIDDFTYYLSLNIEDFAPGIYYAVLKNENGFRVHMKFLKAPK